MGVIQPLLKLRAAHTTQKFALHSQYPNNRIIPFQIHHKTTSISNMAPAVLKKSGVIYGEDVKDLFKYAQEKKFAIPAINCTSSSTVVASLEAARDSKAPIILQVSQGGAAYFAGKVCRRPSAAAGPRT